jgi:hypothetical protein
VKLCQIVGNELFLIGVSFYKLSKHKICQVKFGKHLEIASSRPLPFINDALAAKREAFFNALVAATDRGISHVMNETDATKLVKVLQSNSFDQA